MRIILSEKMQLLKYAREMQEISDLVAKNLNDEKQYLLKCVEFERKRIEEGIGSTMILQAHMDRINQIDNKLFEFYEQHPSAPTLS